MDCQLCRKELNGATGIFKVEGEEALCSDCLPSYLEDIHLDEEVKVEAISAE